VGLLMITLESICLKWQHGMMGPTVTIPIKDGACFRSFPVAGESPKNRFSRTTLGLLLILNSEVPMAWWGRMQEILFNTSLVFRLPEGEDMNLSMATI